MADKHYKQHPAYKPTKYQRKLTKDMQRLVDASHKAVKRGALPDKAPLPQAPQDEELRGALNELIHRLDEVIRSIQAVKRRLP